jgi:hypothetical protein
MYLPAARSLSIVLVLITAGCYQSAVPVAGTSNAVDTSLVGTWEEIEPEASPTIVTIRADSANSYYIEMPWERGKNATLLRGRAFITEVAGLSFVNLHDFEEPGFLLLKLTRNANGTISLATLKENLPHFDQSELLRSYLVQHANDADIIEDQLHLRKLSPR